MWLGDVDSVEDVGEIVERIDVVARATRDEGIEERELVAGILTVDEEEVLSPEGYDAEGTLREVVVGSRAPCSVT